MTTSRIAIVGAGLAGLRTAHKLSTEKFINGQKIEITILEATANVGGRVRTLRDFSSGMYAEAGAVSLTDSESEILELVKELKLNLVDRSARVQKKLHRSNQSIPWEESQENHYFKKYILKNISPIIYDLSSPEVFKLDNMSMYDFLEQKVLEDKLDDFNIVMHAIKISILGLYCDNFSKLSALNGLRWVGQYLNATKSFSIEGGNDQLPIALEKAAKKNGVIILKNTVVTKIKRPSTGDKSTRVMLTVINPKDQAQLLEFDYVVIAVPLIALKKIYAKDETENVIEFEPSLPEERQAAIETMPYNRTIARIYIECNNRFWLTERQKTAMTITAHPTVWIEDHTDHLNCTPGILAIHAAGDAGISFQRKHSEYAKEALKAIWGNEVAKKISLKKPVKYSWNEEFYQKGAYPYLGIRQAHYPILLSRSLPSLSFAGEYTDIFSPASMNGAIKSANRVVDEVKAELVARHALNKKIIPSKSSYSFWLKTAAFIGVSAAAGIVLYKNTHKPK